MTHATGSAFGFARLVTLCLAAALAPDSADPADADPAVVTIADGRRATGKLTAPATGQTLYVLDDEAGDVSAIDPFEPAKRWTAVAASDLAANAGEAAMRAVAIGCVDSNTLAILGRVGKAWSVRTFRLAPPGSKTDSAHLLQTIPLGVSDNQPAHVDLVVSDSRNWLAVLGLPAPLPAIVRAPIAGSRLGNFSERLCPHGLPADRLAAATTSPFDEWVLFSRAATDEASAVALSFHASAGQPQLLRLDLGIPRVVDAAFCRGAGTLWAVADGDGSAAAPAGLWRIDAHLRNGRQAARAECVAELDHPLSLACLSERAIAVALGGERPRIVLVNPLAADTP
jgi:hypothetical protein